MCTRIQVYPKIKPDLLVLDDVGNKKRHSISRNNQSPNIASRRRSKSTNYINKLNNQSRRPSLRYTEDKIRKRANSTILDCSYRPDEFSVRVPRLGILSSYNNLYKQHLCNDKMDQNKFATVVEQMSDTEKPSTSASHDDIPKCKIPHSATNVSLSKYIQNLVFN